MSKSPTQNPQRPSALSLCPKGDDNTRSKLKSPKMVTIADPPAVCHDKVGSLTLFSLVDFLTGDCTTEVTPGCCPCFFVLAEATYYRLEVLGSHCVWSKALQRSEVYLSHGKE